MHCGCATDGTCNTVRCHLSGMKDLKVSGCTDLTKSRTLKTHLIFLTPPVVWAAFFCIRDDNCRRQAVNTQNPCRGILSVTAIFHQSSIRQSNTNPPLVFRNTPSPAF